MERREFSGFLSHQVSLRQLRAVSGRMCRLHEVPPPRIVVRALPDNYLGWYENDESTPAKITLNRRFGANCLVLAHELAHHIVWLKSPRAAAHGPTWLRTYGGLLHSMRLVPIEGFVAAARRPGLRASKL
jgi:hypothetical protein